MAQQDRIEELKRRAAELEAEKKVRRLEEELRRSREEEERRRRAAELELERKQIAVEQARRKLEEARKGPIRRAVEKEAAEIAGRTFRPSPPVAAPKPVIVAVPPPAYKGAKEMPPVVTVGQLGRTIATAGVGAVITAIFITSLQGGSKYVGALIGAGVGTIFLATSPIASIPSDLGIGMLAGATGWLTLKWTGKVE
jgi:hypothetical protein